MPWLDAVQHRFAFGNHANQLDAQDVLNVFQRQHLPFGHASGVVAGDQQVLLDRLLAFDGAPGLAGQHAQDAVRIAHGGDLGVGHDQRFVGEVHGHQRTGFDAGGRIAHDVFKPHGR